MYCLAEIVRSVPTRGIIITIMIAMIIPNGNDNSKWTTATEADGVAGKTKKQKEREKKTKRNKNK